MPPPRPTVLPINRNPAARELARAFRLRGEGRWREAVDAMRQAAHLEPGKPQILHDLGLIYLEVGAPAEAAAAFRRAIAAKPDFAQAFWRLGTALEQCGEPDLAAAALRQALALQPRMAEARYGLAFLLENRGLRDEAARHYREVLSAGPRPKLRRIAEARALVIEGRDAEAENKLRRAVAIEPGDVAALGLLGSLLTDSGAFDEAATCFERALARPEAPRDLYYHLVRCRKITASDADLLDRIRSALTVSPNNSVTLIRLHLALGKALDDLERYGEAMQAFDAADAARGRVASVDLAAIERLAEATIERFSTVFIESKSAIGDPDPTPVLIFGLPRSGTTLCEQIVSAHPAVHGAGELQFWNRTGERLEAAGLLVDDGFFGDAAAQCLRDLRERGGGDVQRITDKMPFNFRWAGAIHVALPRAALIHCRRSPIDTALSIHQTYFPPRMNFPTGGEALVRYIRAYERLMDHWRRVLPPDRFLEIDYEDLTAAPEETARRLIAHIGLEWDNACLRPELNPRRVKTMSRWQARQPVYTTSVGRWRRYEPYLGPLAQLASESYQ